MVGLFVLFTNLQAQAKSGLENYNLLGRGGSYNWMPVLNYESQTGGYGEIRYNYEEQSTVSLFVGKKYKVKGEKDFTITPMLGISAGNFSGFSPALNTDAELGAFFLSAQNQMSFSFSDQNKSFFFNWSEIGYTLFRGFNAGVAAQVTICGGETVFEPGFLVGAEWGKISIPVYFFRPFTPYGSLLIGINFQHTLK